MLGHIAALGFHFVQMSIQRSGDKRGDRTAIGRLQVVAVLEQFFFIWEVF